MDFDSQLRAIRALLRTHSDARLALETEIKEIEIFSKSVSGIANDHAIDEWVDRLHESVFQDAAHSMAAVGMLAPFIEALFKRAFPGVKELLGTKDFRKKVDHPRWQMIDDKIFNCRFSCNGNLNIVAGISELSDALGMDEFMPPGLGEVLGALFHYRNKMFHFGFEWPISERRIFKENIRNAGWPSDWFLESMTGDETWIFYMSHVFVAHSLDTFREVISGLGKFVREFHKTG